MPKRERETSDSALPSKIRKKSTTSQFEEICTELKEAGFSEETCVSLHEMVQKQHDVHFSIEVCELIKDAGFSYEENPEFFNSLFEVMLQSFIYDSEFKFLDLVYLEDILRCFAELIKSGFLYEDCPSIFRAIISNVETRNEIVKRALSLKRQGFSYKENSEFYESAIKNFYFSKFDLAIETNDMDIAKKLNKIKIESGKLDLFDKEDITNFFESQSAFDVKSILNNHEGLTILTSLCHKKQSKVPTVFIDSEAFDHYLFSLREAKPGLVERFIIAGVHWRTGEIRVNARGVINIVLIDSYNTLRTHEEDIVSLCKYLKGLKVNIYIPSITVQSDADSCKIFALDAWTRLSKVEKYLPKHYKDLFDYLNKNIEKLSISEEGVNVYRSQYPLYLMKGMQSRKLLTEHLVSEDRQDERALPINKKGELPDVALKKTFRADKNTHIDRKAEHFATYTIQYMKSTSKEKLCELASNHTLREVVAKRERGSPLGLH